MYTGPINGYDYQCNGEEAKLIFWRKRTAGQCRTDFIYKLLASAILTFIEGLLVLFNPQRWFINYWYN